jgi:hypothetical protein
MPLVAFLAAVAQNNLAPTLLVLHPEHVVGAVGLLMAKELDVIWGNKIAACTLDDDGAGFFQRISSAFAGGPRGLFLAESPFVDFQAVFSSAFIVAIGTNKWSGH